MAALAVPQPVGAAPTPVPTPAPTSPALSAAPAQAPVSVTLITGDRVTVTASGAVLIDRGEGRDGISFVTDEHDGRLRVVPGDAFAPLREGRVDPRLFDVGTLAAFGYDDRRDDLPLVVTGRGSTARSALRSAMTASGTTVTRDLPAVDGVAVRVPEKGRTRFWNDIAGGTRARSGGAAGTAKVWLDGLLKPSLDTSVVQIGAPAAWQSGYTGAGVKVAVLDTGVDATHPDLAGRIGARADFTAEPRAGDPDGHGTHIASTIAGSGAASGGRHRGVAPGAEILDGRVCEDHACQTSAVLAGMQWAAEQGAKVVNLSLGGGDTPEADPLEQAVETLTERHDMLFVVSAGNFGAERSVESPASADDALAVGAVDDSEALADFSARGPRAGDSGLKPEITAPGVGITAARSKDRATGSGPYTGMSGTSMSTPHVVGAAAILAGRHPGWTARTLKAALMGSAQPNPALGVFEQGAGRADVARATAQTVIAEPGGVGFGLRQWPYDDTPVTRKVTYRNADTSPVTLQLSVEDQPGTAPFTGSPGPSRCPRAGRRTSRSAPAPQAPCPVPSAAVSWRAGTRDCG
ncbi:hypothetical protein GCM10017559_56480 [Streptosporangium longisporum]|uniref:Peptidase S8/S53 domain-containing protein n=1 Tax=Streptosporangium longisporum TaxID=46187 RepID=A0ABN3YA44_9ACTN